jgi:hypothetical protein
MLTLLMLSALLLPGGAAETMCASTCIAEESKGVESYGEASDDSFNVRGNNAEDDMKTLSIREAAAAAANDDDDDDDAYCAKRAQTICIVGMV